MMTHTRLEVHVNSRAPSAALPLRLASPAAADAARADIRRILETPVHADAGNLAARVAGGSEVRAVAERGVQGAGASLPHLGAIQTSLGGGAFATSERERDADLVADEVTRAGSGADRTLQSRRKPLEGPSGSAGLSRLVSSGLSSRGSPLDANIREWFEHRLGHDFSAVRIHADGPAIQSARALGAAAYTVGRHVVFGAGHYAPATTAGRRLLGHELAHVLQQAGERGPGASRPVVQLKPDSNADAAARARDPSTPDLTTKRLSVILASGNTLHDIARKLLPIIKKARPSNETGPQAATLLTEADLAKAILVDNLAYLGGAPPVAEMSRRPAVELSDSRGMREWRVGTRVPLPVEVDEKTGAHAVDLDAIAAMAAKFRPSWAHLLHETPGPATRSDASSGGAKGANLSSAEHAAKLLKMAAMSAEQALPVVEETFKQPGVASFEVSLAILDQLPVYLFDVLAAQRAGRTILDTLAAGLKAAPADATADQLAKKGRAERLFQRLGLFSGATAARFENVHKKVPPKDDQCMVAVFSGLDGLFSPDVGASIRGRVRADADTEKTKTGRKTFHMERIMEVVAAYGKAGPLIEIHRNASGDFLPDPKKTILDKTQRGARGWYFFGLSLHGAYHSVILAVDHTAGSRESARIYWLDQYSSGFNKDVTKGFDLEQKMTQIRPKYGYARSRLWQILPAADTLIELR